MVVLALPVTARALGAVPEFNTSYPYLTCDIDVSTYLQTDASHTGLTRRNKEDVLYFSEAGKVYFYKGMYDSAAVQFEKALLLADDADLAHTVALLTQNVCLCNIANQDFLGFYEKCNNAVRKWHELGDYRGLAAIYSYIGNYYTSLRDYNNASLAVNQCLALSREHGYPIREAEALMTLGIIQVAENQPDAAMLSFTEALRLFTEADYQGGIASANEYVGHVFLQMRDYNAAIAAFSKALTYYAYAGNQSKHCQLLVSLAQGYLYAGQLGRSSYWMDSSAALLPAVSQSDMAVWVHHYKVKSELYYNMGDSLIGQRYFRKYIEWRNRQIAQEEKQVPDYVSSSLLSHRVTVNIRAAAESLEHTRNLLLGMLLFTGLSCILLLLIIKTVTDKKKKVLYDCARLTREKEVLLSRGFGYGVDEEDLSATVDACKEDIEVHLNSKLNDTDWTIIQRLISSPQSSNVELAEHAAISNEGIRSSLKKLYRLFDIDDSVANKKMALVAKVQSICNNSGIQKEADK